MPCKYKICLDVVLAPLPQEGLEAAKVMVRAGRAIVIK